MIFYMIYIINIFYFNFLINILSTLINKIFKLKNCSNCHKIKYQTVRHVN